MRKTLVVVALFFLVAGCNPPQGDQTSSQTDTVMRPASPKPASDNEAMTQTVDVEDSRTDAEGGVQTTKKTQTSTTTKKPVAKAKGKGKG